MYFVTIKKIVILNTPLTSYPIFYSPDSLSRVAAAAKRVSVEDLLHNNVRKTDTTTLDYPLRQNAGCIT